LFLGKLCVGHKCSFDFVGLGDLSYLSLPLLTPSLLHLRVESKGANKGLEDEINFTRLQVLGDFNNAEIYVTYDNDDFISHLDPSEFKAAIYVYFYAPETVAPLYEYIQNGGRVMFLYYGMRDDHAIKVEEYFGVRIVENGRVYHDPLIYPASLLPDWLSGIVVGVADSESQNLRHQATLFHALGLESEGVMVNEGGDIVRFTGSMMGGRLVFWPLGESYPNSGHGDIVERVFFDDFNIHNFQNEQASINMLNYLLERPLSLALSTNFPAGVNETMKPILPLSLKSDQKPLDMKLVKMKPKISWHISQITWGWIALLGLLNIFQYMIPKTIGGQQ
jgi:hypothetical protein